MVSIWLGAEQRPALDEDPAEPARAGRLDRQDQGRGAGLVVDHDVGLADLGEGIAAPAELDPKRRLACSTAGGVDRILRGDREGFAQRRRVAPPAAVEPRQPHFGEAVERPRLGARASPRRRWPAAASTAVVTMPS